MDSTSWIDMTFSNSITTPQPSAPIPAGPITVGGNPVYNGTVPPPGALIVSQSPIAGETVYSTIQEALNAAPISAKANATLFIYPGTYNEQLIINKSGSTIFMGYSDATDDFSKNQVTIQQSYGEDTQGTGSDVDAATVYATGNYFYAFNLNFRQVREVPCP
jgi:pectin methylesterase-like acyl-CoA thioesterase